MKAKPVTHIVTLDFTDGKAARQLLRQIRSMKKTPSTTKAIAIGRLLKETVAESVFRFAN
jgi:hypothetical protein